MFKSIIIAFSTYSKIPVPRVEWNKKSMKYSLCFFPLVGAVIGMIGYLLLYAMEFLKFRNILKAALLAVLPVVINGGIHMDGFLDTVDAKSSYKPMEEKLKILKDPNTGAFAVIYGIVYMIAVFGLFSEIEKSEYIFIAVSYIYSRILSGISVVTFKKARKDGMAAASANSADKNVKWIMIFELLLCICGFIYLNPVIGGICALIGLLCFLYYRNMAYRLFGGITGDIAGYFLQVCELCILAAVVILKGLIL